MAVKRCMVAFYRRRVADGATRVESDDRGSLDLPKIRRVDEVAAKSSAKLIVTTGTAIDVVERWRSPWLRLP